jgi:hypothetical protein
MARPRKNVDAKEVVRLRRLGLSWPAIARRMDLGQGTVVRAYHQAVNVAKPFQYPELSSPSDGEGPSSKSR